MKKEEIIKMLDAFASNSFLVPSRHSGFMQFTELKEAYQTYCNDGRNYISIDIRKNDEIIHKITANKHGQNWAIAGDDLLTSKTVKTQISNHHKWLKAIYDEIHSLDKSRTNEKKKEIRRLITQAKNRIEKEKKEISELKQALSDNKSL